MTNERFKPVRPIGVNLVPDSRKPPAKFKDLIEKISGLAGVKEVSTACEFIKNTDNDKDERMKVIAALKKTRLIPTTYELVQGTLQRLLSSPHACKDIKTASEDAFVAQRNELARITLKKVV